MLYDTELQKKLNFHLSLVQCSTVQSKKNLNFPVRDQGLKG